jgi:hypothetical protein
LEPGTVLRTRGELNVAPRSFIWSFLVLLLVSNHARAQTSPAVSVPNNYHAVSNGAAYPKPAQPTLGAAGSRFTDPTFGSQLVRVTDANTDTRGGSFTGGSYSTPSAAHQLAWNATSDRFYVRSISGWFFPYSFDATTLTASRIDSLLIQSHIEPQFSYRAQREALYRRRKRRTSDHSTSGFLRLFRVHRGVVLLRAGGGKSRGSFATLDR